MINEMVFTIPAIIVLHSKDCGRHYIVSTIVVALHLSSPGTSLSSSKGRS